jgi:hypothetical protein
VAETTFFAERADFCLAILGSEEPPSIVRFDRSRFRPQLRRAELPCVSGPGTRQLPGTGRVLLLSVVQNALLTSVDGIMHRTGGVPAPTRPRRSRSR